MQFLWASSYIVANYFYSPFHGFWQSFISTKGGGMGGDDGDLSPPLFDRD